MCSLQKLPFRLQWTIVSYLPTSNCMKVRSVCKTLNSICMINDLIDTLTKAKEAFKGGDIKSTLEASVQFNDLTLRPLLEAIKVYGPCLSAYSEECIDVGMRPQDLLVREHADNVLECCPGKTLTRLFGGTYQLSNKEVEEEDIMDKTLDSLFFKQNKDNFSLSGSINMPLSWWIDTLIDNSDLECGCLCLLRSTDDDHSGVNMINMNKRLWLMISKILKPYITSDESINTRIIETTLPSKQDHAALSLGSALADSRLDDLFIRLLVQDDNPSETVYLFLNTELISRAQGIEIASIDTRRYAELPRLVLPRRRCNHLKALLV